MNQARIDAFTGRLSLNDLNNEKPGLRDLVAKLLQDKTDEELDAIESALAKETNA